jgi:DNA-binding beta-propeller fold protein YncE
MRWCTFLNQHIMSAVYSPHVKFLRKWGIRGGGDGEFSQPQGLVIDGAGNVYVSDQGNDRIQVFDPQWRFLRKWGIRGSGDGEFSRPQGLAIDGDGDVYVSDQGNDRIQVFKPTV